MLNEYNEQTYVLELRIETNTQVSYGSAGSNTRFTNVT